MKPYKKYLVTIIVLGLLLVALFISQKKNPFTMNKTTLEIFDTANLNELDISSGQNKIILNKNQDFSWTLNHTYPARKEAVELILATLKRIEIKSPIPKSYKSKIMDLGLDVNTITIKLKDYSGKELVFKLWQDTLYHTGAIMQMVGSENASLVYIPGFNNIEWTKLFNTNESYWYNNILLNIPATSISSVTVNFHQKNAKKGSFTIKVISRDSIHLESASGVVRYDMDKEQLVSYLYNFEQIKYSGKATNLSSEQASIITSILHLATIDIYSKGSNHDIIETYLKPIDLSAAKFSFDQDKLYAMRDQDNQLVIVEYNDFDLILRDLESFLKK